jgi:outer membrane receptor for ferrienterochelin and colicins
MSSSGTARRTRRILLLAAGLALVPALAAAQTGTVQGTVTGPDGAGVPAAQVAVCGRRISTATDGQGGFTLANVPAGPQRVCVNRSGYLPANREVSVAATGSTVVSFQLQESSVELDAVVVSASRQAQRLTDAPATITKIGPDVLDDAVGASFAGALKEVKGLDYIQVGMTSVAVNARGFNSSFNNRMLMMEDGRIAVLPENGLPVGQFTAIPKVDLAGIEVLVGPGSALYGADASSGVVALQTRDPRDFPGTTVEISGGSRSYFDLQARHAGTVGRWGYKIAGEYQQADDWASALTYNIDLGGGRIVPVREDTIPVNGIDFNTAVSRGTGTLAYYLDGDARIQLSAGASESDGVGQTNVGRNQLRNWQYNFLQAQYTSPRIYANVYRTQSKSGESFAINRYADALARNPALSPDSLRMLSDWPSDGRLMAAEAQTNFRVPALLGSRFVVGAQYRQDDVSSNRQWLSDRLTGEDVTIAQYGVYGQMTTPIVPQLEVVLAGRLDNHDSYEQQFSPKAGVIVRPSEGHAIRMTYNRAFKSPTILQTDFYIPDWTGTVSIYGNTRGFSIRNPAGTEVASYDPLVPEENETWELGYKGVFANRLFVDVTGYYSNYRDFMSPLAIISDPFGLGLAGQPAGQRWSAYDADGNLITHPGGFAPLVLTYYNLGRAELFGVDAGINYFLTPRVTLRANASLLELDQVKVPANRAEATSLNSPERKLTLGATFREFGPFQGGLTVRHVDEYYFRSGINAGVIPSFTTLDASVGYRIPRLNSLLNVSVSNLFSCTGEFTYAATGDPLRRNPTDEERGCGFGEKHAEMINMPAIGTMVFVGLRFDTK